MSLHVCDYVVSNDRKRRASEPLFPTFVQLENIPVCGMKHPVKNTRINNGSRDGIFFRTEICMTVLKTIQALRTWIFFRSGSQSSVRRHDEKNVTSFHSFDLKTCEGLDTRSSSIIVFPYLFQTSPWNRISKPSSDMPNCRFLRSFDVLLVQMYGKIAFRYRRTISELRQK